MGCRFACSAAFQRRSRGLQSDASPGWRPDQPSAGVGVRIAAKSSSEFAHDRWVGHPSVVRPPEATGQGVHRAQNRSSGHGLRARTGANPDALPLLSTPGRRAAPGLDVSVQRVGAMTGDSARGHSDRRRPAIQWRPLNREDRSAMRSGL